MRWFLNFEAMCCKGFIAQNRHVLLCTYIYIYTQDMYYKYGDTWATIGIYTDPYVRSVPT